MKISQFLFVFFILFAQNLFSLSSSLMELTIESRLLIVKCQFDFNTNEISLQLPPRSRLMQISSPEKLKITNEGKRILISQIKKTEIKKVNLSYSIPLSHLDFSLKNWYPTSDIEISTLFKIHAPSGYTALPVPYQSFDTKAYQINLKEKPILISARLKQKSFKQDQIQYTLYYPFKWNSSDQSVSHSFQSFSKLLGKLPQSNLILFHLPNLSDTILTNKSQIVLMLPATDPDSLKRSLSLIWLKKWNLNPDFQFALSDVLKRIFDSKGKIESEDGKVILVPRHRYYEEVLKKGFSQGKLLKTDFNAMLKNFAMLHFAYYTVGISNFIRGLEKFSASSKHSKEDFSRSFIKKENTKQQSIIRYVCEKLLPISSFIPDFSLKGNYLYRNRLDLPDIEVKINTNLTQITWENRRMLDLGHLNGFVFVDPGNRVPQLNFFNDKIDTDTDKKEEKSKIKQAAVFHRQIAGEKFRSFYNLERFFAPKENPWQIPEGQSIYIATVKILAPIQGSLRYAVKEMIMTLSKNNKVNILDSRIRF